MFDIRNILFCKTTQNVKKPLSVIDDIKHVSDDPLLPYISFEHYDFTLPYKVRSTDGFSVPSIIEIDSKKLSETLNGDFSYNSMYIVRENKTTKDDILLKNFWNDDSLFLGVFLLFTNTEIKFHTVGSINKKIREILRKQKLLSIKYLIYYSVDLCDFVLLVKTSEIKTLTFLSNYLQNASWVNHILTIYNSKEYIENESLLEVSSNGELISTVNIMGIPTKKLYNKKVYKTLQNIFPTAKMFYNSSNRHFLISLKNVTTKNLLQFLKKYYNPSDDIYLTFENFVIIIAEEYIVTNKTMPKSKELSNVCNEIIDGLANDIQDYDYGWKKPLLELVNAMVNMSYSDIQDDICYLLIDSISVLSKWLHISKQHNQDLFAFKKSILQYLRACKELNEQIVESEPFFTEKIGYLPKTYNFSVRMIEYYNAYSNLVSTYLQNIEYSPNRPEETDGFACLTTPKLCRRIKTMPIIPDDNPPCDSILYIELPYTSISDPFLIMTSILHEVAHLLTDKHRCREERIKYFINCVAIETAINLYIPEYTVYDKFSSHIYFGLGINDIDSRYLRYLKVDVKASLETVLEDPSILGKIIAAYLKEHKELTSLQKHQLFETINFQKTKLITGNNSETTLTNIINDIAFFFSECYADMVMVFTLSLSIKEYISVFESEFKYFDLLDMKKDPKSNFLAQRILIVMSAFEQVSGAFADHEGSMISEKTNKFYDFFIEMKQVYEARQQPRVNPYWYSCDTLGEIIEYLIDCLNSLQNSNYGEAKNLYLKIRQCFENVAVNNKIFDENFWETIHLNRIQVLEKAKNNIENNSI